MRILMYIAKISYNFDTQNRIIIIQTYALSPTEYCNKILGTTDDTLRMSKNCCCVSEEPRNKAMYLSLQGTA